MQQEISNSQVVRDKEKVTHRSIDRGRAEHGREGLRVPSDHERPVSRNVERRRGRHAPVAVHPGWIEIVGDVNRPHVRLNVSRETGCTRIRVRTLDCRAARLYARHSSQQAARVELEMARKHTDVPWGTATT